MARETHHLGPYNLSKREPAKILGKMYTCALRDNQSWSWVLATISGWIRLTWQVQSLDLPAWHNSTHPLAFDDKWSPINYNRVPREEGQALHLWMAGLVTEALQHRPVCLPEHAQVSLQHSGWRVQGGPYTTSPPVPVIHGCALFMSMSAGFQSPFSLPLLCLSSCYCCQLSMSEKVPTFQQQCVVILQDACFVFINLPETASPP